MPNKRKEGERAERSPRGNIPVDRSLSGQNFSENAPSNWAGTEEGPALKRGQVT